MYLNVRDDGLFLLLLLQMMQPEPPVPVVAPPVPVLPPAPVKDFFIIVERRDVGGQTEKEKARKRCESARKWQMSVCEDGWVTEIGVAQATRDSNTAC